MSCASCLQDVWNRCLAHWHVGYARDGARLLSWWLWTTSRSRTTTVVDPPTWTGSGWGDGRGRTCG
eukprot:scaffold614_cov378-Pavlova_lutheri.AAC.11